MKLTIKCTREHLERAMFCGTPDLSKLFHQEEAFQDTTSNCWIALACHDIFPYCSVSNDEITNSQRVQEHTNQVWNEEGTEKWTIGDSTNPLGFTDEFIWRIDLPQIAQDEIRKFDKCLERNNSGSILSLEITLDKRMRLEPFEFEVDISPNALNLILLYNDFNLQSFKSIIEKAPHLELTETPD